MYSIIFYFLLFDNHSLPSTQAYIPYASFIRCCYDNGHEYDGLHVKYITVVVLPQSVLYLLIRILYKYNDLQINIRINAVEMRKDRMFSQTEMTDLLFHGHMAYMHHSEFRPSEACANIRHIRKPVTKCIVLQLYIRKYCYC